MTVQTSALRNWSTTASSNNSAAPDGMPEGMPPSGVNDWARKAMAELRKWHEQAQWIDFGHSPTRGSDTTFTVAGDLTALYVVGRAVRVIGASTGYGLITGVSYSNPNTTVTVSWRSGTTPTTPTSVQIGALSPPGDADSAGLGISWLDTNELHTAGKSTQRVTLSISSGDVAIDLSQSNMFRLAATAAFELNNPTNPKSGQVFNILVKMDGTGGYAVTFDTKWKVTGEVSNSANAYSIISVQYDDVDDVYLAAVSVGFA